ncbi:MAG: DsbA family protein [Nanobdellota archaeon]
MSKKKSKENNKFWKGIAVVLFIIIILIGLSFIPKQKEEVIEQNINNNNNNAINMEALIENDDVKGDKNAPVTIIEWSDYECPFCARFYSQTLSMIEKKYIDTGKAKLVFRDFPLPFHNNAQKSAEAAECAGEQNKYYEMHDLLFEKGVDGGVSSYKEYASSIGLDRNEFDQCLDSGRMKEEVQKDMADGSKLGIQGTPGFMINGKLISGAQPFEVFKDAIESALEESS